MNHSLLAITQEGTRQAWATMETAALVYVGVGLIVTVLALGWFVDWRRGRAARAAALEAQVTDALMNEPDLAWTSVAAVAHVPAWPTRPATLELRGQVSGSDSREKALRAALRVLADYPGRVRLEDRLWVEPAPVRLAA
jgi:hypothetical protein